VYITPKKFLIFRDKSRQIIHQAIFGRLRKNQSAAQRTRSPSMKTGDSQKLPGLVSKRDGVTLPS